MFLSFPATFLGLHVSLWAQKQLHKLHFREPPIPATLHYSLRGSKKFSPPQNPNQVQALALVTTVSTR